MKTYFPDHEDNRMQMEGDVYGARARFFENKPPNLTRLLQQRYGWMNDYIKPDSVIVEFGAGAGFSREFIKDGQFVLTDVICYPWIDCIADATNPPFHDESIDVVICSHMIHHLAYPTKFFKQVSRLIRPGGVLLIQDIELGELLRLVTRIMRHEGWSYEVDVFAEEQVANNPSDPWSGNNAIPHLLFVDGDKFEENVPQFKIERSQLNECFLFLLSGGVIATAPTIQLPRAILTSIQWIDRVLVAVLPSIFAMGRSIVLRKTSEHEYKKSEGA